MKKSDYEKLLDAEKEFIPEHYVTLYSFWTDKQTHYHIFHCPRQDKYKEYVSIRSWMTKAGDPAVSVDIVKGNIVEILSYVVNRFAPQTEHAPMIEEGV